MINDKGGGGEGQLVRLSGNWGEVEAERPRKDTRALGISGHYFFFSLYMLRQTIILTIEAKHSCAWMFFKLIFRVNVGLSNMFA